MQSLKSELGWTEAPVDTGERSQDLGTGDRVRVLSLSQVGVIDEMVADGKGETIAVVKCGNMKVKINIKDLQLLETAASQTRSKKKKAARGSSHTKRRKVALDKQYDSGLDSSSFIRTSGNTIELRGKRVEVALDSLDEFLDGCTINGTSPVMIIHGHGTGAVKSAVREYLTTSNYSKNFRPGELYEGGDGVTVVDLI